MNEQLDMQVDEIDEVDKSSIAHTLVNNSVDLDKFDAETRELYSKKANDPRLSMVLSVIPRPNRHNLPVIVDSENNKYM